MLRTYIATSVTATSLLALHGYATNTNNRNGAESTDYQYALTPEEKEQIHSQDEKPIVVALYDKPDGTTNTDLAIEHFREKGINVVKVPSREGFNHPIFTAENISGIFLPGGPNVPVDDDSDPRKKFEGELIELARKSDIPLLGICRGQQTIGHSYRSTVEDIPEWEAHYGHSHEVYEETGNPNLNNKVSVEEGSLLYSALRYKFRNDSVGNNPIEYAVTCLHEQHITSNPDNIDSEIKVTARNPFNQTVEGIEIPTGKYYTIGLQHHPEAVIYHANNDRKEKIEQAVEAAIELSYLDPDHTLYSNYKAYLNISERSKDERAARAELGLFANQAKKKHLDLMKKGNDNSKEMAEVKTRVMQAK